MVSGGAPTVIERAGRPIASSGPAAPGFSLQIVDPETLRPRSEADEGEIWVSGPSVAKGYWGQAEGFEARIVGGGEETYLRTGDLGFLREGELFVTGRRKDLIIVRGRNVYPQDLERTASDSSPALNPDGAAAFALDEAGEQVVIVAEVERSRRGEDAPGVLRALRQSVAEEHDIDLSAVVLIRPMSLPRTSSGKVRRLACRAAFVAGTLDEAARWTRPEGSVLEASKNGSHGHQIPRTTAGEIAGWLAGKLAGPLGIDPADIDVRAPFSRFGLGSLRAVELAGELETRLGRSLSPTLIYEYPTIEALSRFLSGEDAEPLREIPAPTTEPIAILGIGCRFPGASGPEAFWDLLIEGRDTSSERNSRDSDPATPRRGGFLDRVDEFDAAFFGIAPREAERMDPQQRILLEVAWEALEDAGQAPERLAGSAVGVFVGLSTNDYGALIRDAPGTADAHALTGNAASIASNRISFAFDFRGPSLAVDSACSSSLVAVHLACESLRRGESSMCLAGGANLILSAELTAQFSRAGFLSPDGRCKAFDASADGYSRGEGAGIVVLKRHSDALRDGDPIVATILGSAVNQDGRSNGLTAPNGKAQEAAIGEALRRSGLEPDAIGYVEAHGTGTLLGDPIEALALGNALGLGRNSPCPIGSVKTNFGHLEAAAGVAGLIKTALSVNRGMIPPSLHLETPNPLIPFDRLPIRVAREAESWPDPGRPRTAGVSAFGFGGTNAHMIVQSSPDRTATDTPADGRAVLLPISARDPDSLLSLARSYRDLLTSATENGSLAAIAATAGARRGHHDHRLAIVVDDRTKAIAALSAFLDGTGPKVEKARPSGPPRLAIVFSGQGALWAGAGRDLLVEPVFRATIERCDAVFRADDGPSVLDAIADEDADLSDSSIAQPVHFAIQVGLASLWKSWGIVPDSVTGHSLGEVSAAHVSGAIGLEDACRIVRLRGALLARVAGRGRTAAVDLDEAGVDEVLRGREDRLFVAARNGPRSFTLSGDSSAVGEVVAALGERQVFARMLDVDFAFHSPRMDPVAKVLAEALGAISARETSIPMISTVTGREIDGRTLDATYWARNLREPVRFSDAVEALAGSDHRVFLEIGPRPVLVGSIEQTLRKLGREGEALGSIRRGKDGRAALLDSLGALYRKGFRPEWARVNPSDRFVRLPRYPWKHERFWIETPPTRKLVPEAVAPAPDVSSLVYELTWTSKERASRNGTSLLEGRWVISAGVSGEALESLARGLRARGASCEAFIGEDRPSEMDLAGCRAVILLADPAGEVEDFEASYHRQGNRLLDLIRRLASTDRPSPPRLWIVTHGAQPIGSESPTIAGVPLWGLGRSIALEFPQVWGGLIDADPDSLDSAAILEEITHPDGEDQIAFRDGRRSVARLMRTSTGDAVPALRPDGTYLITGGLGALGLKVARRLADRGAKRLVLVGRRGLPDRSLWDAMADHPAVARVRELEAIGVTVMIAPADCADRDAMGRLFSELARTLPPIRGIVHAAGLVRPGPTVALSAEDLLEIARPKAVGAILLDELSRSLPIDFFVAFSSITATIGAARSAAYSAANAALDAVVHRRRSFGLPGLSIGWGPWSGSGMAAEETRTLGLLGLRSLDGPRALAAFDALLASGSAGAIVADVDWPTLKTLHGTTGLRPLFDSIDEARPIDRRPSKAALDLTTVPPAQLRDRILGEVRETLADVLKLAPERIDTDRPLLSLGLDSLMAMEFRAGVEERLGLGIPLASLMKGPSLAEIADELLPKVGGPAAEAIEATGDVPGDHPLAPGQQALWFLQHVNPEGAAHTIAGAARIRSRIDVPALRDALRRLVVRHPALRTSFPIENGLPVQRVVPDRDLGFSIEDVSALSDRAIRENLDQQSNRPFDLAADPLLRVALFTRSDEESYLLLALHHIVGDFWSVAVMLDELGRLYREIVSGEPARLGPLPVSYTDFARWQRRLVEGAEGDRLWSFWKERLGDPLPVLELPTDRPRPAVLGERGGTRTISLDSTLTRAIVALAESSGASLYSTLLSAFSALLARLSGQTDVIVGSPVAGRGRPGLEGLVGYCVNLVPMRADLADDPTFARWLERMKEVVRDALEHAEFPFPEVVRRLAPTPDPSRSAIFQAMFIYQKAHRLDSEGLTPFSTLGEGARMTLGGLALEAIPLARDGALFDLTLSAALDGDRLALALEYNSDLYDPATADRLLGSYQALLRGIATNPNCRVSSLPILPDSERNLLLDTWSRRSQQAADRRLVHELVEAHALATPDAEALVFGDLRISFGELNSRANRLANHLKTLGVEPEKLVAVEAGRTPGALVAILAVLKAGGAYVPLDPEHPPTRWADVLDQSRPVAAIVERASSDRLGGFLGRVVHLEADRLAIESQPCEPPAGSAEPRHLAYVIFTSGSSGRPKGVMVEHESLAHAFRAWEEAYRLADGPRRHLQMAGGAFDVFTGDWVRALASGGCLVSCPRDVLLDPEALADLIVRERIEFAEFVPAVAEPLVDFLERTGRRLGPLKLVAVGSDLWRCGAHERFRQVLGGTARVVNSYGLTEATIDSTFFEGSLDNRPAGSVAPIGRPLPGTRVYVLDARREPVPIGALGELFVGGPGVARGYWNQPELTAERFIRDPFSAEPGRDSSAPAIGRGGWPRATSSSSAEATIR